MAAALAGEDFEDGARSAEAALGGLIRIGGGADGDGLFAVDAAQFLAEEVGGGGLGVDGIFEVLRGNFHELVGIAGVAIFAAEFAPPVGIDGPLKRHVGPGAVEDAARGQLEIPHFALFLEQFAPGSQSRDAYELHGCYFRLLFAFWQVRFRTGGYNMPMPENTFPENLDAVLRKWLHCRCGCFPPLAS